MIENNLLGINLEEEWIKRSGVQRMLGPLASAKILGNDFMQMRSGLNPVLDELAQATLNLIPPLPGPFGPNQHSEFSSDWLATSASPNGLTAYSERIPDNYNPLTNTFFASAPDAVALATSFDDFL
ncbi:MAG: hypothetical protein ON057_001258 [Glomeribacter sp. 1016415]|nr:hypothetical protein [Glomeribacter sp. 1016415]